jgi:NAD(P)-dependent dehydrogenase (short-subunit alcohol dehydrogenase family)
MPFDKRKNTEVNRQLILCHSGLTGEVLMSSRIIISASSDIGMALAHSWLDEGHQVTGTFRTQTPEVDELDEAGMSSVYCDLSDPDSIETATDQIESVSDPWDVLVVASGVQDPIGPFAEVSFDEWEASIMVNFTSQLRVIRRLLDSRNLKSPNGPRVLFFAGGGTNNATLNYSAYTISKIALIKMTELLEAEIPDTGFSIVGPGWVKTKIHNSTLDAGDRAGDSFSKTKDMLAGDATVPLETVVDCCNWIIGAERSVISGRNFSVVFDGWGNPELDKHLKNDPNMYKLRRSGNDVRVSR